MILRKSGFRLIPIHFWDIIHLIFEILKECGAVATWKRIQGSNGKFQAFGFCEFESPFGTMRALRILHDYPLAEKKLVVKVNFQYRNEVCT